MRLYVVPLIPLQAFPSGMTPEVFWESLGLSVDRDTRSFSVLNLQEVIVPDNKEKVKQLLIDEYQTGKHKKAAPTVHIKG